LQKYISKSNLKHIIHIIIDIIIILIP